MLHQFGETVEYLYLNGRTVLILVNEQVTITKRYLRTQFFIRKQVIQVLLHVIIVEQVPFLLELSETLPPSLCHTEEDSDVTFLFVIDKL